LLQQSTEAADDAALATIAARDLNRSRHARLDWRTATTDRLRTYARNMRSTPTEAERRLWLLVRDRRLAAYKFRRQVPIGRYIVDMLCAKSRLIVELDGSQHAENAYDAGRDAWLAAQGFRVLRVWNGDLLAHPDGIVELIWSKLQEEKS
jgi:very-short-patch-repair endonuclease